LILALNGWFSDLEHVFKRRKGFSHFDFCIGLSWLEDYNNSAHAARFETPRVRFDIIDLFARMESGKYLGCYGNRVEEVIVVGLPAAEKSAERMV
jgi:hypothetical protein